MHVYVYIYIYLYIHTYIHTYIHAYIHTYIHTYICIGGGVHVHRRGLVKRLRGGENPGLRQVSGGASKTTIYIYIYIYVYVYVYVYIYIYIHIYTHVLEERMGPVGLTPWRLPSNSEAPEV